MIFIIPPKKCPLVYSTIFISQNTHRDITVRGRLIFDDILEQLGLPMAQYEQRTHQSGKISITVIFQLPIVPCHSSPHTARIDGIESFDVALAEHTAAVEAIRYMQDVAGIVAKDLNYNLLQHADEENRRLQKQLETVKLQVKKETIKSKKLARGWFWAVRKMFSFSSQFHNVAVIGNFGGQEVLSDDVKANIFETAATMKSKSIQMESILEQIRYS
uniref:Uncharacterized protein n=1 Tax=Avena sativa TaxID=4498 RepID=A0ACD5THP9_AVESA